MHRWPIRGLVGKEEDVSAALCFVFHFFVLFRKVLSLVSAVFESHPAIHSSSAESRHDSQLHFYCIVVVGFNFFINVIVIVTL